MTFNAPQIIWVVLATMGLTISAIRDGEPKTGNESFWVSLICTAISFALLVWGGFFG